MADNVLHMGVRGVTDLMVKPGVVNLDFADIRTVMAEMGKAMMGTGEAEGEDRAVKAAEAAITNPLLEDTSLRGARGVLINITGGLDMTLFEVDEAANRIRKEVDEDANIIFGSSVEEDLNGRLRVSVVATGIDAAACRRSANAQGAALAPGRRAARRDPHPGSRQPPARRAPGGGDAVAGRADGRAAACRRRRRGRPDGAARPGRVALRRRRSRPPCSARSRCRRRSTTRTACWRRPGWRTPRPPSRPAAPRGPVAAAASTVPGVSNGIRRIFQEMTGAGLMRRNHRPCRRRSRPPLRPRRGTPTRRALPARPRAQPTGRDRPRHPDLPAPPVNPTDCAARKTAYFQGLAA